jgi:hypothetical protein
VSKVISLLKDMQAQLEKEGKEDEEVYAKVSCWCETNGGDKLKAVEDAEAKLTELQSTIESATAKSAQISQEIADLEAEIADNQAALDKATAIREKALEEFTAEEKDLLQSVQALKDAIVVLSKHHDAPEEELLSIAAMVKHQLHKHAKLLRARNPAGGLAVALTQGEYAPQSGEIFGILQQMKETFETNLSASQKQEMQEQAGYEELKTAKLAEIGAGESQLAQKRQLLAETDEKAATAKQDLEDTREALTADQKFLLDLKQKCAEMDTEMEARKKARAEEIAAVGEALSILSGDDAHDLFSKTLGFVQLSSASADSRRARAAKLLASEANRLHSPELATVAVNVRLDAFTKVKAAIDKMVTELEAQQADEVKHRDFCTTGLAQTEKEQQLKGRDLDSLAAHIEDLGATADTLGEEIAGLKGEIAEMTTQVKRAGEDRESQNADFQQTVSDQRAAQTVLQRAVEVLEKVYAQKGSSLVEVRLHSDGEHKQPGPPPPPGFKEYKKAGGGTGVIGMIKQVIADAARMEKDAIQAEQDSQAAYESFVQESNNSVATKQRSITNKMEAKAEADAGKTAAIEDQKVAEADLQRMKNEEADLHKSCDFVLQNFEIRQAARAQEVEALRQAKAILSGATFTAFLARK